MSNKAHPHAESMRLYAEDAAETDKPWERWEYRLGAGEIWTPCTEYTRWIPSCEYRRKPIDYTLIQGYTLEQWEFIREQGFDCEFSDQSDFSHSHIGKLSAVITRGHKREKFEDDTWYVWYFCRPRRAKGVKQPWFGGECPVFGDEEVTVYLRNGFKATGTARSFVWNGRVGDSDIIAFIEL